MIQPDRERLYPRCAIRLEGGTLTVLDWEELKRVGDFDPTYLHLENREAA